MRLSCVSTFDIYENIRISLGMWDRLITSYTSISHLSVSFVGVVYLDVICVFVKVLCGFVGLLRV